MAVARFLQLSPAARLFAVSIMLLHAAAAPPHLELAKWNKAYKLSISNIDAHVNLKYNIINPACSKEGYNSNAAAVPLDSCFVKQDMDQTYSTWTKMAGEWRVNSNCYCYALDVYKGGFCIPGFHEESVMNALKAGEPKTCDLMTQGLLADGAQLVSRDKALSAEQLSVGHYIGLLVRKRGCSPAHCWNDDFHLVRRDANGFWSWKEPGGPVQAVDVHGQHVSDPEASTIPGHYDIWCAYFLVDPANMTIGGNFGHDYNLRKQVEFLRKVPGVQVSLHTTPYNHTVDGASDKITAEWLAQNAEWHAQQGTKEWDEFYAQQNTSQSGGFAEHFAKQRHPASTMLPQDKPTPHDKRTLTSAPSAHTGQGKAVEYLSDNYRRHMPDAASNSSSEWSGSKHSASGWRADASHHTSSPAVHTTTAAATARDSREASGQPAQTQGSRASPRPAYADMPVQTTPGPSQPDKKPADSNTGNRNARAGEQHVASKEHADPAASPAAATVPTKGKSHSSPDAPAINPKPSRDPSLSSDAQSPKPSSGATAVATAAAGSLSVSLPPWTLSLQLAHAEASNAKLPASATFSSGSLITHVVDIQGGRSGRRMLLRVGKQHGHA